MRILPILILLALCAAHVAAQTHIRDSIPGGVWTKAGSPYIIHDTVELMHDLTIEPGVVVQGNTALEAEIVSEMNAINAVGTEADSIYFFDLRLFLIQNPISSDYRNKSLFEYCV